MKVEPLLSVRDLAVDYITDSGRARAVRGLSFEIAEGEAVGLLGESGSGKSTAAMALLRLLPAPAVISSGTVRFRDRDVLAMSSSELRSFRFREASIVLQSAMNALCPTLTIGQQVADTIQCHESISKEELSIRVRLALELVGLEPRHQKHYPHQLSGGMRQRVVMAIALALRPKLLILDEPTTALDVVLQKEILGHISELRSRLGFSVLMISHDLSLMLQFCDRIGVMYAGSLVEVASSETLQNEPLHPYTRGLFQSFPGLSGPRRRLAGVPGSPPDLRLSTPGCAFRARCASGDASCEEAKPLLQPYRTAHEVACFKTRGARE